MAINQNHLFEELNGVKCSIVEKNADAGRVDFLRRILEYNGYTVVVVASPPPKGAAGAAGAAPAGGGTAPVGAAPAGGGGAAAGAGSGVAALAPPPETFTVGVTDVMFNPVNAIFGRLLKREGGHVVTLAYWQGKGEDGERPYFEK